MFASGEGFVTALMVSEGDRVEAGQPLARIGTAGQNTPYQAPLRSPSRAGLVHAPLGGRVEAVRVQLGEYVAQGASVAVVAAGDGLVAEIFLPSHAFGLVEAGQRLRLRYDAMHLGGTTTPR